MVQMPSDLTLAKEICREGNIIIYMDGLVSVPLGEKKKGALYIDTQKSVKYVLGKFVD